MKQFSHINLLDNATPSQKIIWNDLFLRFGNTISIKQFFYQGSLWNAEYEFNFYQARKWYFAYELKVYVDTWAFPSFTRIDFNEDNIGTLIFSTYKGFPVYDPGIPGILYSVSEPYSYKNVVFNNIQLIGGEAIGNAYTTFVGYRIGI
jgi:hypothetical protein